jgi:hypothetical protein
MITISYKPVLHSLLSTVSQRALVLPRLGHTPDRGNRRRFMARVTAVVALAGGALLQTSPVGAQQLSGHRLHGEARAADAGRSGGPVIYQTGPVMHQYSAYLIFWLPPGYVYEPGGNDQRFARLMMRYFQDVGGSSFLKVTTQYGDATGAPSGGASLGGIAVDRVDPYPRKGTTWDPLRDSDIRHEISRVIRVEGWTPSLSHEFFVFTGVGVESCLDKTDCSFPTGKGGFYAGYHDDFMDPQARKPVIYANLPDVATTLPVSGTMENGDRLSPNGDWIADSEISVLSHEQFESITDPFHEAWGDRSGQEIADKCEQIYGTVNEFGANLLLHGDPYIVQAEWSNAAGGCALSA